MSRAPAGVRLVARRTAGGRIGVVLVLLALAAAVGYSLGAGGR